jgi:uncharacterized cofD-like protein
LPNGLPKRQGQTNAAEGPSGLNLFVRLLRIGLGIKRWVLTAGLGIGVCAIGLAFVAKNLLSINIPNLLPWHLEGVILFSAGIGLILLAIYGLYNSLGPLLLRYTSINELARTIYTRRSRERGPRIVAIGGGTGLSILLSGLKTYTDNITAIVTVADDGGSSGRLRRELGVMPPGDFRNCLVALSDDEGLVAELFQYRFDQGEGLEGHSFGNLFIAAMTGVTGSFEQALLESSKVLAVHGRIIPVTWNHVDLTARLSDGTHVHGESNIAVHGRSIDEVHLEPPDIEANPEAIKAIAEADLILVGPGSLYTSIIPNLLVPGVTEALQASSAQTIYICNIATEKGETGGFTMADHVRALQRHTFPTIADSVIANGNLSEPGAQLNSQAVPPCGGKLPNVHVITADLIDPKHPLLHDAEQLARVVIDVYHGRQSIDKEKAAVAR